MKISAINNTLNSGENLVNFINNVSTCVKTVLSKPGCFKRNTNHRRFLQKQLRQSVQDKIEPIKNLAKSLGSTAADSLEGVDLKREPESPRSENGEPNHTSSSSTRKVWKQKTIRKRRRYNPLHSSPPPHTLSHPATQQQPPAPPLLIPSPTAEYPIDFFTENDRYFLNTDHDNFFRYTDSSQQFYSPISTTNFYNSPPVTEMFNVPYSRKTSPIYVEEGFGVNDFLSGEDLMQSLQFGDLFIPDCSGSGTQENELAFIKTYTETEKQIQYLARLEALEACYQAREHDLMLNNLIPDL